ncbi:MAG: thiamine pyrophosphate-binding protein [Chloroflexota bacterium]
MATITGGEALLRALKRNSVDTIFGLVGQQMAAFYNAWNDHPDVREVGVRHEQAAAYMAMGYAAVAARPGVCLTVSGPGALNTAAAMGTAAAGSIPVLLISGQVASSAVGKGMMFPHQLDAQSTVFRLLLKGSRVVQRVEEIPEAVNEAFRVMLTGRPGPYELEIPMDVLAATGEPHLLAPPSIPTVEPDDALLRRVARELAQARRPIILAGGGIAAANASAELRTLVELLHAPVYTSFRGKGALPDDHPQSMGASGDAGGATSPLDPEADLVLALGTRMCAWRSGPRALPQNRQVIQVDIDAGQIGRVYPVATPVVGDLRRTLTRLVALLRELPHAERPRRDWAAMKRERQDAMSGASPEIVALMDGLRRVLPRDTMVAADVTVLGGWSGMALDMYEPGTYLTSTYFSTLGFAFPALIGAQIARPERPALAISGDGAFLFNLQELNTACRYHVPTIALVQDNGGFGTIQALQEEKYGRAKGHAFTNPDWTKLADAFGARCFSADGLEGVPAAVEEALERHEPGIVVVKSSTMPSYALSGRRASR